MKNNRNRSFCLLLSLFVLLISVQIVSANPIECSGGNVTVTVSVPGNLTDFRCLTVPNAERAPDGQPLTNAKFQGAAIVFEQLRTMNPLQPELNVMPITGLSQLNPEIYVKAEELSTLINSVNTNGIDAVSGDVPVLPVQEKSQLFSRLLAVLQFQGGVGIRFLTAFGDAGSAVSNGNLLYGFQGLTVDGKSYVSVLFPIQHANFTDQTMSPREYNWAALPDDGWTPRIADLDKIIESIVIR